MDRKAGILRPAQHSLYPSSCVSGSDAADSRDAERKGKSPRNFSELHVCEVRKRMPAVSLVSFVVKLLFDHQGHKGHGGNWLHSRYASEGHAPSFGLRSCPSDGIQNVIFKLS